MNNIKEELEIINSLTLNKQYYIVFINERKRFYVSANICLNSSDISQEDKDFILQALFINNFRDYNYEETEEYANLIKNMDNLDKFIIYELGRYYTYTRRYDLAKKFLEKRITLINEDDNEDLQKSIHRDFDNIEKRQNGTMKEYLPDFSGNKVKYCNFMESLGFKIDIIAKKPQKIAEEDYPNIKENEISNFNFDNFVAFDLETTGFRRNTSTARKIGLDDIIEIAAIKVVNGKIDETEKFTFQELVHPLKQKISPEIEELTGITNKMVKGAKQLWDVFPRFMEFVGDNILVGFNCINFDCDFLIRAGRYSNIIIENKFFDIYRNLNKFDLKTSNLAELSNKLNIKNPRAHRALSDAITTAKIFMKLKEMKNDIPEATTCNTYIKVIGGTNQDSDTIQEIWENLISDCDEQEESIIMNLLNECPENIEKPIYNPTIEFITTKQKITVNEFWNNAKVMLFLPENQEDYNIAKENGWNCFMINKDFNIKKFIRSIKI